MINLELSFPHQLVIDQKARTHSELGYLSKPYEVWVNGLEQSLSTGSTIDITNGLETYLTSCKYNETKWKPFLKAQTKYYSTVKEEYATRIIHYTIAPYIERLNLLQGADQKTEIFNLRVGPTTGATKWKSRASTGFKSFFDTKDFDTGLFQQKGEYYFPLLVGETKGYVDKTMADSIIPTSEAIRGTFGPDTIHFTLAEDEARGNDVVNHSDLTNLHVLTASKRSKSKSRNTIDHDANTRFIEFLKDASIKAIRCFEKSLQK